jgi:hypothetical protein
MPSPFSGMDPYLEAPQGWLGFHNDLAAEIRAALNRLIQPRYYAELDSYVTYEVIEIDRPRSILPDVLVSQPQPPRGDTGSAVATAAPAPAESRVPLEVTIYLDRVEVRTTGVGQLVTLIEILSPANKRPSHDAYTEYQRKRREVLRSPVHLMEIDLLRGGTRPPLADPVPVAPYYVVLSRADRRPRVEVWPIQIGEPLPLLPVPLLEPDPDTTLDLNAMVASVYERGAYGVRINYTEPPPPPALTAEQAQWVETRLREYSTRGGEPVSGSS